MEAAKKRLNVSLQNFQSDYAQNRKSTTSMDASQVMRQVQERIAESMRQQKKRSQTVLHHKSVEYTPFSQSMQQSQTPNALQQPSTLFTRKPETNVSEKSRPDTPPFENDGKSRTTPTHVKISDLTSSMAGKINNQLSLHSPPASTLPTNLTMVKTQTESKSINLFSSLPA